MSGLAHNPGGRRRLPLLPGMTGGAILSGPDECYRPILWRAWDADLASVPLLAGSYALWCGLNPSEAAGDVDDPTVRLELGHTRRQWPQVAEYRKMNVSDYRCTKPSELRRATVPLRSPDMLDLLAKNAAGAAHIVVAFGCEPLSLSQYVVDAMKVLTASGHPLMCLGRTKNGSPRHPLYLAKNTPLELWA